MPDSGYLLDLTETELHILRLIRSSSHRVSIGKISQTLCYPREEATSAIRSLLDRGYIRQDRRDKVEWNHEDATFFTERSRREQIDDILGLRVLPGSSAPRALRVFLCHSSGDKPVVRALYRRLLAEQIDPWLDESKILAGQDWDYEIRKAIRESDAVVVCLSRSSIDKEGYVQKEIVRALDVADEKPEGTIFIIPLRLEECDVPDRLGRWQWVDYFGDGGYRSLMRSLRHRAANLGITASADD